MATAIVAAAAAEAADDTNQKKKLMKKKKEVIEWQAGLLTLYSDGTFERRTDGHVPPSLSFFTTATTTDDGGAAGGVATRDVQVSGAAPGVWARIFLPHSALAARPSGSLPVVLHFHGGGFCVGSPAAPHTYRFCHTMASASGCLWISVAYRLAPEHKLPAAYHDAMAAFRWLLATDDSWVAAYADRSRVFVAGESAGGTIAHFLAADIAKEEGGRSDIEWTRRVAGVIVVHPAFPQEKPPNASSDNVENLSSARVRFYHESALPAGAPFGHPLMNPLHPNSSAHVSRYPRSVPLFLAVAERDPLCPGALLYFHALQEHKESHIYIHPDPSLLFLFQTHGQEASHCFHLFPDKAPAAAADLRHAILTFISRHRHHSSSSSLAQH